MLRNAIDSDYFAYNETVRDYVRADLGLEKNFIILQIARLVYQKNHIFSLSVFSEISHSVSNAVLLLAGDGNLRQSLEAEATRLGISDKVRFLGFRSDIPQLLQAADLFILPSLFEGLGISAIEAQCSGIQCLLSNHVPDEAIITDNAIRLPLDVDIWCDKIVDIARNGYNRYDRSAEIAAAGYSLKDQIKILENLYSQ